MLTGLYGAATAMDSLSLQQEIIASNLAHASVPGHRGRVVTFSQVDLPNESVDYPAQQGTRITQVATDFTPGIIQETGRGLDVAISGDGFFEIQGPNGPLYTRNGSFHADSEGNLVTVDGRPVLGEGGPLQLTPPVTDNTVNISESGEVFNGDQSVGKLKIVNFSNPESLQPVGTTLFETTSATQVGEFSGTLLQRYRESSNVSAVNELIRMMVGMRQFEAAQRAMRTLDASLSQHIQQT